VKQRYNNVIRDGEARARIKSLSLSNFLAQGLT